MTSRQEAKMSMYDAVLSHCKAFPAITSSVPAFQTAVNDLNDLYVELQLSSTDELLITTGITDDKENQRLTLVTLATDIAAQVFAYASETNNLVLKGNVKSKFSDFNRLKDELLGPACKNVLTAANANAPALIPYGVTAAKITALDNAINNFGTAAGRPRNATSTKVSAGKTTKELFTSIDKLLKERLDRLALQFKTTEPAFYKTYKNNRIIVDAGTRNTQAKGTIADSASGKGLIGVAVTVDGQSYVGDNTLKGSYTIKIPVPGTYTIIFTLAGYQTLQQTGIEVKLGQTTTLDVQLAKL